MRYIITPLCLVLSVLLAGVARAEDDAAETNDRAGRRAEMRQKILDEFDADGDGELNDEERSTARQEMRSRRGDRPRGEAAKGDKAKGDRARRDRGPARDGQGRRGGQGRPGGPPDPGKLFDRFDANGDGQLSRAEFTKLTEEMRANRPPRRPGDRDSASRGGPPREARRSFERDRPLQNRDGRPGPPPRPEGRRRLNDADSAGAPGILARGPRGNRGQQGPRARGAGGRGMPDPGAVFERFDENNDNQLSRQEFMKLADRMRQMQERMGQGGERGARDGRGARRGPPGDDGPQRRRRPQRPDLDDAAETKPAADNTV